MSTKLIEALNKVVETQLDLISVQHPYVDVAPLKAALGQLNTLHAAAYDELRDLRAQCDDPPKTRRK